MTLMIAAAPDMVGAVSMAEALEQTWRAIRRRDRDIPRAGFQLVTGAGSACVSVDWADTPIIKLGAATLAAGPEEVLRVLLHQAAHAIVSRREDAPVARFHGEAYRSAASSLRLLVSQAGDFQHLGWADTSLPTATAGEYARQLEALAVALAGYQPPAPARGSARNGISALCPVHPDFRISIRGDGAAQRLADHPIICGQCGEQLIPAL
jgi:hypothetical protein